MPVFNTHKNKTLLRFLLVSIFLHAGVFIGVAHRPAPAHKQAPQVMVDLQDSSFSATRPIDVQKERTQLHRQSRTELVPPESPREVRPREQPRDASVEKSEGKLPAPSPVAGAPGNEPAAPNRALPDTMGIHAATALPEEGAGERLITRKDRVERSRGLLFPSRGAIAELEEKYRRKYKSGAGGETFFDESDDVLGPFNRRFLEAVRGRWKLVGRRLLAGREYGYGLLSISINRDGSLADVDVVESSGNAQVDAEIIKTIKTAGYVGPLPKRWPHDRLQGYYAYSAGYEVSL